MAPRCRNDSTAGYGIAGGLTVIYASIRYGHDEANTAGGGNMLPIDGESQPLLAETFSTSVLGRILGVKAKPYLFDEFQRRGYLERLANQYVLTARGKSPVVGGHYRHTSDGNKVVVWPIGLGDSLMRLKQDMLDRSEFRLFHMTHLENLKSISKYGLNSHNTAPSYIDISNPQVNRRRERQEPVHKRSLHDYVPMYFNPRNAMLYEKQMEHSNKIVILEIDKAICLSRYTLFTDRNAAAVDCRFFYCPSDLEKFEWQRIFGRSWADNGICDIESKQMMMSECLVHECVDTSGINAIHTLNSRTAAHVHSLLDAKCQPEVKATPGLFF